MPIFEFRCKRCDHQFETLVRSTSGNGVSCPSCESGETTRLFSTFASGSGGTPQKSGAAPRPSGGGCGPSCGCH